MKFDRSPDFAKVTRRDMQKRILWKAQPGISPTEFAISPDLKRTAFVLRKKRGFFHSEYVVVLDGLEHRPYPKLRSLVFSPDSAHIMYVAETESKNILIVDGDEQFTADMIGQPTFSSDSKHFAISLKNNERWSAHLDGKPISTHELIDPRFVFSPDGQHIAYRASDGKGQFVVLDGNPGSPYAHTGENSIVFSHDSSTLAYAAAKSSNEWSYSVGNILGPSCPRLTSAPLVFSPDDAHFAYGVIIGGNQIARLDHSIDDYAHGSITGFAFSPDSSTLFYSYMGRTVADIKFFQPSGPQHTPGVKGGMFAGISSSCLADSIDSLLFSPNGKRLLCVCVPQGTSSNPSGLIPSSIWSMASSTRKSVYILHGINSPSLAWDNYFEILVGTVWDHILPVDGKMLYCRDSNSFRYVAYKHKTKTIYEVQESFE